MQRKEPKSKGSRLMIVNEINEKGEIKPIRNIEVINGLNEKKDIAKISATAANSDYYNYIIMDPDGESYAMYKKAFENNGYEIKRFDPDNVENSEKYNPLQYIKNERDAYILASVLIENTVLFDEGTIDTLLYNSSETLLTALILYLWYTKNTDKGMAGILDLIYRADISENDPLPQSELDIMFFDLEKHAGENTAVKLYKIYKLGTPKLMRETNLLSASVLSALAIPSLSDLTRKDTLHLEKFISKKQVLFIIIPSIYNRGHHLIYASLLKNIESLYKKTSEDILDIAETFDINL